MGNPWIELVTKTFNDNKKKAGYSFKKAIKVAIIIYKKGKTAKHLVEKPAHKGTQKAHRHKDSDEDEDSHMHKKHQDSHMHKKNQKHQDNDQDEDSHMHKKNQKHQKYQESHNHRRSRNHRG